MTSKIRLTPAQNRAWSFLRSMDPDVLRHRGVSALSEVMGITRDGACKHVQDLVQAGVVTKTGRKISSVARIRNLKRILQEAPVEKGASCIPYIEGQSGGGAEEDPRYTVDRIAASTRKYSEEHRDFFAVVLCSGSSPCSCSDDPVLEHAEKTGMPKPGRKHKAPPSPGDVAASVRKVLRVEVRKDPPGRNPRPDTYLKLLESLYVKHRTKVDPLYAGLFPADREKMRLVFKALTKKQIGHSLWDKYMAWIFDRFPVITAGRCSWPPVHVLGSSSILDNFANEELKARGYNLDKAAKMLAAGGFAEVDPGPVVSVCKEIRMRDCAVEDMKISNRRYEAAVRYLLPIFDRVGYSDAVEE